MAAFSQDFDEYVEGLMKRWQVPQLSLGLVHQKEEGVWSQTIKHFSTIDGSHAKDSTVFGIASCSKFFTALAIGILVDQGKVLWEDKVLLHLPEFRVADERVTREATLIDLAAHRLGTTKFQPFMSACLSETPSSQTIPNLSVFEQAGDFRNCLVYHNLTYTCLAEIIAIKSGMPFIDFMRTYVFDPLNMTDATYRPQPDLPATPHALSSSGQYYKLAPFRSPSHPEASEIDAAGGIFLSPSDSVKFFSWLLKAFKGDDCQAIVSLTQIEFITSSDNKLHLALGLDASSVAFKDIAFNPTGYCCGVNQYNLNGLDMFDHHGTIAGYGSTFVFSPSASFGIFVTTSLAERGNAVAAMTALKALASIQGWKDDHWEDRYREDGYWWTLQVPPIQSEHKANLAPDHLETYCGLYETSPKSRMVLMTLETESLPPRCKEMQADIKNSFNLNPYTDDRQPALYLCSPDRRMTGVTTCYYALLPTGKDRFFALARYISKPKDQVLDMQVRMFGDGGNGQIVFNRKKGMVDGFSFTPQAPDVAVVMHKVEESKLAESR